MTYIPFVSYEPVLQDRRVVARQTFIAFGLSCISKVVPLDGSDSWDVFRWHYGGWRWHDNVGDGTVEYIRTNATEIAAPMTEPRKETE